MSDDYGFARFFTLVSGHPRIMFMMLMRHEPARAPRLYVFTSQGGEAKNNLFSNPRERMVPACPAA